MISFLYKCFLRLAIIVLIMTSTHGYAQSVRSQIENAAGDKNYAEAFDLLNTQMKIFAQQKLTDSLTDYLLLQGEVVKGLQGVDKAIEVLNTSLAHLKSLNASPGTMAQAYVNLGEFYGGIGRDNQGYKANETAYGYAQQVNSSNTSMPGKIQRNMGVFAQRTGDINRAIKHHQKALVLTQSLDNPDYEELYQSLSAIGVMNWYSSQNDSALAYFQKALAVLKKTKPTPFNKYYRPAIIENNMAGIYNLQGNPTAAIRSMEVTIENLKQFMADKEPHPKKATSVAFQLEAIDNLGGIYKEIGDYSKAHDLLLYSYEQKQKKLAPGDAGLFKSQIIIGQLYYAMRNYDKAIDYLQQGLDGIHQTEGDYLFWEGDACYGLALVHEKLKNTEKAAHYYEMADSLYELSAQGAYDNIYLEFLHNAAMFYAVNGNTATAFRKAHKAYDYVVRTEDESSLLPFYQLLGMSEVYYEAKKYPDALQYSVKALETVNRKIRNSQTLLDSVLTEYKKPRVILLKAKTEYELMQVKNAAGLEKLLNDLNEGLQLLDRRKNIIQDEQDINLMIADHAQLLEFIKKITLELYQLTGERRYIDDLISVHESSLYNRIRSRLDKREKLQFANVPQSVIDRELQLKNAIPASLRIGKKGSDTTLGYLDAVGKWERFLKEVQQSYPDYYRMKFASIFHHIHEVQQDIPASTTVVRYIFIGEQLTALVADRQQEQLIVLDSKALKEKIERLPVQWMDARATGAVLHELYDQLWAPLEKYIRYSGVIIIPDGILYHISFESLTFKKTADFADMVNAALINKYRFSYLYSLFQLHQPGRMSSSKENFVAFVPGFNDDQKNAYAKRVSDTMYLDKSYLSLLPLPFTGQLAEKMYNIFGGALFSNDNSTASSFKAYAGDHNIIHIGTHAESNNKYPELSRLIFSKGSSVGRDENSLFLYDIYGCDLHSQLTVLTACESGKPGLMDGEGMISLAHAFNYAGSESIVTGLWKIDEQSSAIITEYFYRNLLRGLKKDEALRQAKLSYLKSAKGRMLAPQYWSGLVVMGDIGPLNVVPRNYQWLWLGITLLILVGLGIWMNRKNSQQP